MPKNINIFFLVLTGVASLTIAIGIGRFSYTPILPYMISELNLTTTEGGLIASSNFFGYLVGSLIPILPFFPKRIKNLFFVSIVFCILSVFLMGCVSQINYFLFLRFVHGVFSAFVLILGTSIILPYIQEYGKIYLSTAHFSGVGLGMVFSALVVSILGSFGFKWYELWFSIGILSTILFVQIILFTPNEKEIFSKNKDNKTPSTLGFALISTSYSLYGFGYVAFGTFISTIARTTPILQATETYIWGIVGACGIPSVFIWNFFGQRIGNDIALFIASLLMGIGIILSVTINNPFIFILSAFIFGITFVPITSMSLLEGQKRFSGAFIISTAILTSSFSIGQMIGPYIAGFITDLTGSFFTSMQISGYTLIFGSFLMINPKRLIKIK